MQELDYSGMIALDRDLAELLRDLPELRKGIHEELAEIMKERVDSEIGGDGKVKEWQEAHVGSGGGYAAIRPKANTYAETKGGTKYAVGYLTNAIENGHSIRSPGAGKNYRPRIKVPRVKGRYFYQTASLSIEARAIRVGESFADTITSRLEGRK